MFKSAAELGREFRSEVAPMLKSKGFDLRIATSRRSYYHDGKLNVSIIKVPTNFPVWTSEYSRWDRTDNADRVLSTIKDSNNLSITIFCCIKLGEVKISSSFAVIYFISTLPLDRGLSIG